MEYGHYKKSANLFVFNEQKEALIMTNLSLNSPAEYQETRLENSEEMEDRSHWLVAPCRQMYG